MLHILVSLYFFCIGNSVQLYYTYIIFKPEEENNMKLVLKEWMRSKKASAMLIIACISQIVSTIINSFVVIMISTTVSDLNNLKEHLTNLIIILVIQTMLGALYSYFRRRSSAQCYTDSMNRYATKILNADMDMFIKFSTAHINTVAGFVYNISMVGLGIMDLIVCIISVCITSYSMYFVAGTMVIPVICVYLVSLIMMKILFNIYDKFDVEVQKITKKRNQILENIVNGFSEIRLFNRKQQSYNEFTDLNHRAFITRIKKFRINSLIGVLIDIIDSIGIIMIILYASTQIKNGTLNQSQAMSLVMYIFRIINPILVILNFSSDLSQDLALHDSYEEIINYKNTVVDKGTITLESFNNSIHVENLKFSYKTSDTILNGITMDIKRGQKVGICGSSGAGKSTIFKLLGKFYNPSIGNITIDGIDITAITDESYREHIGVVQQENTIFPDTIKNNILYASPNSTEYELIEACKQANLYDFIMSLPNKFDTEIGHRGLNLSGGQKQRIALARLMLIDPEIILLDEATSALDNESEAFVQKSINSLHDKTIITIAHRLSTIKNCDVIYVINDGIIVEQGTHEELMKLKGVYYNMNTRAME